MNLTTEQEEIIQAVKDNELVKVIACAGTGKTTTLLQIVKAVRPKKALYIAFNKAIAEEAKTKFPTSVECKTIHALALKHVCKEIDFLTHRDITDVTEYEDKMIVISALETFFNSSSTNINTAFSHYDKHIEEACKAVIKRMQSDKIKSTFGFILKYFHLMLKAGHEIDYDMVLLDEAGDTTGVTLEIFKLIKANKKIMVGDPHQNIYGFMNTINGFDKLANVGVTKKLTVTFRNSQQIAKRVELFAQKNLEKDFKFSGEGSTHKDGSYAYISRTNSQLIFRMIMLKDANKDFTMTRSYKEIFALPLALISIRSGKEIFDSRFKWLEDEHDTFTKHISLGKDFFEYLKEKFHMDYPLLWSIKLLRQNSFGEIFETYNYCKNMKTSLSGITLTTAHACKGLEYDEVYIEDDLSKKVNEIIEAGGPQDQTELEELNLAYVACTRARHKLHCDFL